MSGGDEFPYRLFENKQGLAGSPPRAPPASTEIYATTPWQFDRENPTASQHPLTIGRFES